MKDFKDIHEGILAGQEEVLKQGNATAKEIAFAKEVVKVAKDIEDINALQKQIINHVKNFVKNGGYLVYSTCTINKLENEWFIKDFLTLPSVGVQ